MLRKSVKILIVVTVLVTLISNLAGCATPTPEVIEKIITQVVKETIKETVIVEGTPQVIEKEVTKIVEKEVTTIVEKVITATPLPPTPTPEKKETSITILVPDDPPSFNGVLTFTGYERVVQELVMLSLTDMYPNYEIYPELALELPTVENGGVVVDEDEWTMDVTWKLRDDVFWADGEKVTAEDVIFTYNAVIDPEKGIWTAAGDYIDSIEMIDDYTFVIYYNTIYPAYLQQWSMAEGYAIFPEHYCDLEQGYASWDCNENPLSNGPYILEEWERGDHLTFVRNPNYFEEGKPYIDKIYVQVVPEASVRKTMLSEKTADVDFWAIGELANELEPLDHIGVSKATATRWLVHLWFNLAAYGEIDPVEFPHPVLSDVRVRQAMRMAMDIESVVAGVWPDGSIKYIWTEFFRPPYNECDIPKPVFDAAAAAALLEEAGWTDTDGDGVRECHGCTTGAPEGYELALEFTAWSEFGEVLILAQQLMAEYLEAVCFDLTLSQETGAVLWETYDNGGLEQNGLFDMVMWDDGYAGSDPTDYIWCYFHSDAAEPDACWNTWRYLSEDFDALSDETWTVDEEYRKELFCDMAELLDEDLPAIPLFDAAEITIYNNRIEGIESTVNAMVTWNVADWKLVK